MVRTLDHHPARGCVARFRGLRVGPPSECTVPGIWSSNRESLVACGFVFRAWVRFGVRLPVLRGTPGCRKRLPVRACYGFRVGRLVPHRQ